MSGLKDFFKKTFGNDNQDPIVAFEAAVDAEHKKMKKNQEKKEKRQQKITECVLVMKECKASFENAIRQEREISLKKKRSMIPIDRERTRIREAAIGIMVTDMALLELESISSEADLNSAMNQMGKALKQLVRLDNTVSSISNTSRKFIDMFYPGFNSLIEGTEQYDFSKKAKVSLEQGEDQKIASMYEIPQEMRDRIDDELVDDLLAGDSYRAAMFKAVHREPNLVSSTPRSDTDGDDDWSARVAELTAMAPSSFDYLSRPDED